MRLWIASSVVLVGCGGGPAAGDDAPPGACDPARGPAMTQLADATAASGIAFDYETSTFRGSGLAVVDLDGDGLPDVVAGRNDGGGAALYVNRGGLRFELRDDAGIDPTMPIGAIGAADLDNDGDRDLVLAGDAGARVLENRGDGRFVEAARFDAGATVHVLPVDLDGDGLLELYFSNYDVLGGTATQNRLYLNRGGLQLVTAGMLGDGLSWTATAFDVDGDGDQDLHVANDTLLVDFGKPTPRPPHIPPLPPDLVLRNDGPGPGGVPQFTDIAAELGLAAPRSSMGGLLGDFDDDGRLDLFIPDYGAKKLFVRTAAGGFAERAVELGVAATGRLNDRCGPEPTSHDCLVLSWSAALADFELDGRDELLVVNGGTYPGDTPPVVLFARGDAPGFHEVAPSVPCMDARAMVVTDLDGDGDPDVAIARNDGPLAIYETLGAPPAGSWLRVALAGTASNRDGVGAVVTARLATGRTTIRVVGSGGVIHAASPAEAVFGTGGVPVERLEVAWPSGRRSELAGPLAGAIVVAED